MRKLNLSLLLTATALSSMAFASVSQEKIAYGLDNRIEGYQASAIQQKLAKSTAGMIENIKLLSVGDHYIMPPATIESGMGLCKDERFVSQPQATICSGFLVGEDLLVTAGHCVLTKENCESRSWVFDYAISEKTGRATMMVKKSKVFHCKEVIEAKLVNTDDGDSQDYALIRLDRKVKDREPLKYRTEGKIKNATGVTVIGYPSGLPLKVTPGGKVFENIQKGYFVTNLDTFGGNSGSAVFNAETNEVEGILVRGAKDYISDPSLGCARVNNEVEDITNRPDLGESVSRITNIKALMNKKDVAKE